MKDLQAHKKNQNFILFWLGLLTGALLILALYSVGGSEDLLGKVRGRSYQAPTYSAPVSPVPAYNYNSANVRQQNFEMPSSSIYNPNVGQGYDMPTEDYNWGYNSVLHVAPSTTGSTLRSRVTAPSVNRFGVTTPNYGAASMYAPVINNYDLPTEDYSAY